MMDDLLDEGSSAEAAAAAKANTGGFQDPDPNMTAAQRAAILAKYASIPHDGIRQELYEAAFIYYDTNLGVIQNKQYLTVVDFQKQSGNHRFFIMDMTGGPVSPHVVAHGAGSDPDDTGIATIFSNTPNSGDSSLGYYVTAETYIGKHGESLRIDGLSSTDSNVRDRVVVIHSAAYVEDGNAKQGRSLGCFALPESEKPDIVAHLKGGSVIYAMN
jgi:hypothetical protein